MRFARRVRAERDTSRQFPPSRYCGSESTLHRGSWPGIGVCPSLRWRVFLYAVCPSCTTKAGTELVRKTMYFFDFLKASVRPIERGTMAVHQLITETEDQETVEVLQDLLAKAQRGEIRDFVAVCSVNDEESNGYMRHALYKDRWRLLGALEYAKSAVLHEGYGG